MSRVSGWIILRYVCPANGPPSFGKAQHGLVENSSSIWTMEENHINRSYVVGSRSFMLNRNSDWIIPLLHRDIWSKFVKFTPTDSGLIEFISMTGGECINLRSTWWEPRTLSVSGGSYSCGLAVIWKLVFILTDERSIHPRIIWVPIINEAGLGVTWGVCKTILCHWCE